MAKQKTTENTDKEIIDLVKGSIICPLFFATGIDALKQVIDKWDDDQVQKYFNNNFPAKLIRTQIKLMHAKLYPRERKD